MDEIAAKEADWRERVQQVLEKFESETAEIFRNNQTGNHDDFLQLLSKRMGRMFDRIIARLEREEGKENQDRVRARYNKELTDFTVAAKRLAHEKAELNQLAMQLQKTDEPVEVTTQEESQPKKSVRIKKRAKRRPQVTITAVMDELPPGIKHQMTISKERSEAISMNDVKEKDVIGKSEKAKCAMQLQKTDEPVEFTTQEESQPKKSVRIKKRAKRRPQATITAVMDELPPGIKHQMTISKERSGAISMNGVKEKDVIGKSEKAKCGDTKDKPKEIIELNKNLKYKCVHCQNKNQWNELFNAPKDVYTHWLSMHSMSPKTNTFQYNVVEYASCYHCHTSGTYFELIKHHKKDHPSMSFAIVDEKEHQMCALCSYKGTGIVAHFNAMHKLVLKTLSSRHIQSVNTIQVIRSAVLDKYLESKVHKKHKCGHCSAVLQSDYEFRAHHGKQHKSTKVICKDFFDLSPYLICNCCNVRVDRKMYLRHVESRAFNDLKCHKCSFKTNDLLELVKHDKGTHHLENSFEHRCLQFKNRLKRDHFKTKVIFGNGLVLTNQNLLYTKYDDSQQFDRFVQALLEVKRERHSKIIV